MKTKIMPLGAIAANCIILWDETAPDKGCLVVDPGAEADEIAAVLDSLKLAPAAIALTHGHFDHVDAIPGLRAKWPALPIYVHPADEKMLGHPMNCYEPEYPRMEKPDNLKDVRELPGCEVIETPGHTPGSVCLKFGDTLLSGDTLFAGSCGRTDFPGGSMAQMKKSLARLAQLPPETKVIPGHGMPTTIGHEVATNPFMA